MTMMHLYQSWIVDYRNSNKDYIYGYHGSNGLYYYHNKGQTRWKLESLKQAQYQEN